MLRATLCATAARHANHQGDARLPAKHIGELRRAVDDLVACQQTEVHRHEFGDGAQASERRANRRADDHLFGQRRVAHTLLTKLLKQAFGDGIGAPIARNIFAKDVDTLVALHLLTDRFAERVSIGYNPHDTILLLSGRYHLSSYPVLCRSTPLPHNGGEANGTVSGDIQSRGVLGFVRQAIAPAPSSVTSA